MPRPRSQRKINFDPSVTYFKPSGVPKMFLDIIDLSFEEMEALRLKDVRGFDQTKCATVMKTSQSTFQRILVDARKKVSKALVYGKAIRITKN